MKSLSVCVLLLAVACTKGGGVVDNKTAISPGLALTVESARAHVRDTGEKRVSVIWHLYNTSTSPFTFEDYTYDEFYVRDADGKPMLTLLSMGTDGAPVLEAGQSVTLLSVADFPGATELKNMKFAVIRKPEAETALEPGAGEVAINVIEAFPACDQLSVECEKHEENEPLCATFENVRYPLAFPIDPQLEKQCAERLEQVKTKPTVEN